jgi:hypothetical protein
MAQKRPTPKDGFFVYGVPKEIETLGLVHPRH